MGDGKLKDTIYLAKSPTTTYEFSFEFTTIFFKLKLCFAEFVAIFKYLSKYLLIY